MAKGITKQRLEAFKKLRDTLGRLQRQEDGASEFWTLLYQKMENTGCIDAEYIENTERWRGIEEAIGHISEMDFKQCCSWLTWALRGERFCEGLFEDCIKQGYIQALLGRICGMTA